MSDPWNVPSTDLLQVYTYNGRVADDPLDELSFLNPSDEASDSVYTAQSNSHSITEVATMLYFDDEESVQRGQGNSNQMHAVSPGDRGGNEQIGAETSGLQHSATVNPANTTGRQQESEGDSSTASESVSEWTDLRIQLLKEYAARQVEPPLGKRVSIILNRPSQFVTGTLQLICNRDGRGTDPPSDAEQNLLEGFVDLEAWAREYLRQLCEYNYDEGVVTLLIMIADCLYEAFASVIDRIFQRAQENKRSRCGAGLEVRDFAFGFDVHMNQDIPFFLDVSHRVRDTQLHRNVSGEKPPFRDYRSRDLQQGEDADEGWQPEEPDIEPAKPARSSPARRRRRPPLARKQRTSAQKPATRQAERVDAPGPSPRRSHDVEATQASPSSSKPAGRPARRRNAVTDTPGDERDTVTAARHSSAAASASTSTTTPTRASRVQTRTHAPPRYATRASARSGNDLPASSSSAPVAAALPPAAGPKPNRKRRRV